MKKEIKIAEESLQLQPSLPEKDTNKMCPTITINRHIFSNKFATPNAKIPARTVTIFVAAVAPSAVLLRSFQCPVDFVDSPGQSVGYGCTDVSRVFSPVFHGKSPETRANQVTFGNGWRLLTKVSRSKCEIVLLRRDSITGVESLRLG